ncbi:hypothetical protein KM92DES2_11363 [uncultured Desulfovibrio sp.]|uniref:Uncharacterized protein n=1 Tax=uncultured Desulfovibrio sp. TaxID=167968 RepID=A0A212JM20_9BACT|nr:hypothetical protein KM92DES2_11363 [uncultured Desulfovibrio sp.]
MCRVAEFFYICARIFIPCGGRLLGGFFQSGRRLPQSGADGALCIGVYEAMVRYQVIFYVQEQHVPIVRRFSFVPGIIAGRQGYGF